MREPGGEWWNDEPEKVPLARGACHSFVTPRAIVDSGDARARLVIDIRFGDNLDVLKTFDDASFDLIYIDPPFNTGREQRRTRLTTARDDRGDRTGFKGKRYRTTPHGAMGYGDAFDDYLGFLAPRLAQAHRLLTEHGSVFVHLDYREVHYVKVALDGIFGRECFQNEIVWAYDYGARSTTRWPAKHDNILWY